MINKKGNIESSNIRFCVRECPVLDSDAQYDGVLIVLEDKNIGKIIEIVEYSKFLYETTKMLNLDKNTRLNYAKTIVMFLNSIFIDRGYEERILSMNKVENLDKIENLTIEDGNLFLIDYKYGRIGKSIIKSKSSVILRENLLARLYYYLFLSEKYNMKYLKAKNFKFITKTVGSKNRIIKFLRSPFSIVYPPEKEGVRLENVSFYAVTELIKLALLHYPMIAFGICLQAFAGLRVGDVTNVSWRIIKYKYMDNDLRFFRINLMKQRQLRSDGVSVGQIKTPGIAQVHPSFLIYFDLIFRHHQKYIREDIKKKNLYGAMFLNQNGDAMTVRTYAGCFNELVDMLITILKKTGNLRAISEANMMLEKDFTTHTLRFFFSQFISRLPNTTIFDLAMFRRDSSLESSMTYIRSNPYIIDDKIKEIQDNAMRDAKLWQ